MFIALEGPDGAGKTSVTERMADILEGDWDEDVVRTYAPGHGGEVAEATRRLMLDAGPEGDPIVQFHLSLAGHRDQYNTIIKPALRNGQTILSDRYALSIYAYQRASGLRWDKAYEALVDRISPPTFYVVLDGKGRSKADNAFDTASTAYKRAVASIYNEVMAEGEFLGTPVHGVYHSGNVDSTARYILGLMDEH